MLGEFLFALTPKDAITQPVIQRRINTGSGSASATTVTVDLPPVPPDKIELVKHITIRGFAGAAQTVTQFRAYIVDSVGPNIFMQVISLRTVTPVQFDDLGVMVNLTLMPGERIRVLVSFNAGAAANSAEGNTHGLLLPKGNMQLR